MERMNWDEYFIQMAFLISKRATCIRRAVGAVIVKDNKILATGYNGAPKGIKHCSETGCYRVNNNIPSGQQLDQCNGTHAEQNAIIQAAITGVNIEGAILYCTTFPCNICAKMIINCGIEKIYYVGDYNDQRSKDLFKQINIKIIKWENANENI